MCASLPDREEEEQPMPAMACTFWGEKTKRPASKEIHLLYCPTTKHIGLPTPANQYGVQAS